MCRPATQGSLDPSTPYIEVPEGVDEHEDPGDDLPYYFVTIVENGAAHAPAAVRVSLLLAPRACHVGILCRTSW